MTSFPLYPAVRHARLSADHARTLLGPGAPTPLFALSSGEVASDGVLVVEGPSGRLEVVRVLLPFVPRSHVALTARDAEMLGLRSLSVVLDGAPGCTLVGPVGVVVLAEGVVAAERAVLPPGERPGVTHVDVGIDNERPRVVRGLPVERGVPARAYVFDESGDVRLGVCGHLV